MISFYKRGFKRISNNQAYINKFIWILENDYYYYGLHKATEYEVIF